MDKKIKVWWKILDLLGAVVVLAIASIWFPLGDLLFLVGAFFMIHYGILLDIATDDPAVQEKIRSGK